MPAAWLLVVAVLHPRCVVPAGGVSLPVEYLTHRWALQVPAADGGAPLRFYLDTGGGTNMLYPAAAKRLGLVPDPMSGSPAGTGTIPTDRVPLPTSFPPFARAAADARTLFVPPANSQLENDTGGAIDGFLSRVWFADRVWTFDYPGHTLRYHGERLADPGPADCWVSLGFQTDSTGRRTTSFPRVSAVVDGDTLQLLFDTGAMTTLADSALGLVADGGPARRGTSFITQSVADRWHDRHPDWRWIDRAEARTAMAMIEVPAVTIGGATVGPVWFTTRRDQAFHQYMSQWMDQRVDGAIGGSAFRYLVVTIDYPRARAQFLQP